MGRENEFAHVFHGTYLSVPRREKFQERWRRYVVVKSYMCNSKLLLIFNRPRLFIKYRSHDALRAISFCIVIIYAYMCTCKKPLLRESSRGLYGQSAMENVMRSVKGCILCLLPLSSRRPISAAFDRSRELRRIRRVQERWRSK